MNVKHPARKLLVLLMAGSLAIGPAFAEKPEWAGKGGGKHEKHEKHEKQEKHGQAKHEGKKAKGGPAREDVRVGGYFTDKERGAVRTYYGQHYGGGKGCPPGLAKKNNGCLPPGQAKKYVVGQPLPAGVAYHPVPQPVLVYLPPAPAGHRYVQVAGDILLLAVGTSMVVDALTNLTR